jgi:hypothetical protein
MSGWNVNGRRAAWIAVPLLIALIIAILLTMGRPPICACGTISLWHGAVNSAENSQQISDWYSFSHVIHGFLFYGAGWLLLRRRLSAPARLACAVALEGFWEILENSPIIIDRYRTATIALGYTGDSVLNSVSDIGMMMLGFLFAARMPVKVTILTAIAFELFTLWMIRDNLTLNILMLAAPVDAIRVWQAGA